MLLFTPLNFNTNFTHNDEYFLNCVKTVRIKQNILFYSFHHSSPAQKVFVFVVFRWTTSGEFWKNIYFGVIKINHFSENESSVLHFKLLIVTKEKLVQPSHDKDARHRPT